MRTHVPAVSNARAELIGGPDQPDGTFDRLDHRVQGRLTEGVGLPKLGTE